MVRIPAAFFFLGLFCQPDLSSIAGFSVAPFFFFGDEYQRRYSGRFVVLIQGHECEVGGGGVTGIPADNVFSLDPDADLHGCPSHQVDARLYGQEVADIDGVVKIHAVDGCRDHGAARVLDRHDTGGIIDIFHDHTAMGDAGEVCILGLYDVSQDDTAVIDCFSFHK